MTKTRLSGPAEQVFIDDALLPDWEPSTAVGYDVQEGDPQADAFIPVGNSLDDVGEAYPSLTIQRTNETTPGSTSYNFLAPDGPGQDRQGQLLATARAEEGTTYTGDSATHDAVDADTLVNTLIDEVEDVCLANAEAHQTEISPLGGYRGADAPDDFEATPTVRIEQCIVVYSWQRIP
ncbi:hypothetical protein [Halovenus marina]|uniref:hypothetical protein n=1 Tax=Halovenus marina TaxID=3396621 RepID=UPI003F55DA19